MVSAMQTYSCWQSGRDDKKEERMDGFPVRENYEEIIRKIISKQLQL